MSPARPHQSLSVRLLVLVVSVVLLVEALIFIPGLQRERGRWLRERLDEAQLVVLAAGANTAGMPPASASAALARLSDAQMIRIQAPTGPRLILQTPDQSPPARRADLTTEGWLEGYFRALGGLVQPSSNRRLELIGTSRIGTRLDLLVSQATLAHFLRAYALRFAGISALIAAVTGGLLFVALRAMLVVPLRRMARNIAAFRTDPERGVPLDAERVSIVHDDEITIVGRELSAMQTELRTALWRNARLAAVGTAVSKMSHDLRGILSSALLVADRLTMSRDDTARHAGEVIVRAVHRATALAQSTLSFVREGPPALTRARAELRPLIDEAAAATRDPLHPCTIHNAVAAASAASIDRECLLRVLTNLFRNAAQAGASRITVTATGQDAATVITVADDGPGVPDAARARLFSPFAPSTTGGTGLGLAIARDLMRAHGGDLKLAQGADAGAQFTLFLQQPKLEED